MANRKEFIDELALLANLSHPNIVQFLGAVTTHRPLVMVTEFLPNVGLQPPPPDISSPNLFFVQFWLCVF